MKIETNITRDMVKQILNSEPLGRAEMELLMIVAREIEAVLDRENADQVPVTVNFDFGVINDNLS